MSTSSIPSIPSTTPAPLVTYWRPGASGGTATGYLLRTDRTNAQILPIGRNPRVITIPLANLINAPPPQPAPPKVHPVHAVHEVHKKP